MDTNIQLAINGKENKIAAIQYLRGLAALGVVLCHYGSNLKDYPLLSSIFNKGQLGVHVFFLISGFVIVYALINNAYHPRNFFRFLLKRSVRIEPVYLVTIGLTLVTFALLPLIPSFKGNTIPFVPGQFLAHVFYVVPFTGWEFYNHVFWTLGVEFQFYLLIGLLYFLSSSVWYRVVFMIFFIGTAFIPLSKSYYIVFNYAPLFSAGISLMHYKHERNPWYLLVLFLCLIAVYFHFGILITVILFIAVLLIQFANQHAFSLLDFLGRISYSLYITHTLLLIYLLGIAKRLIPDQDGLDIILLVTYTGIAVSFAYLFYLVVERPAIRWSKRIAYKAS